jgi:two-component system KDP operon response regulator KdpE
VSGAPESTVLIVDDDAAVSRLVAAILEQNGYEPIVAENGREALDLAESRRPSAVVLDLKLPGLGGMEVCTQLRSWYQGPILVLSGTGDEGAIVEALDRGADDFLAKPFNTKELLARLRALFRRANQTLIRNGEIVVGELTVNFAKRRVYKGSEVIRPTRTEFDILEVLVRNLDVVVTSDIILERVWGRHHGEYAQTLRVHVGHIRRRIEDDSAEPKYLLTEPGVGYRFTNPYEDMADDSTATAGAE